MLNKIAATVSAATIVLFTASAAFAVPVALGGTNTRGTSSGAHRSHGMHHMKMKHMKKHM